MGWPIFDLVTMFLFRPAGAISRVGFERGAREGGDSRKDLRRKTGECRHSKIYIREEQLKR